MIRPSPKCLNHPTQGAQKEKETPAPTVGGYKESTTGGGRDQHDSLRNHASRLAADNHGIEPAMDADEFRDSGPGENSSQGSTLTKAGWD